MKRDFIMGHMTSCKTCGKITQHSDKGLSPQGKKTFECSICGTTRGLSKNKINNMRAARDSKKAQDREEEITSNNTSSDKNVSILEQILSPNK